MDSKKLMRVCVGGAIILWAMIAGGLLTVLRIDYLENQERPTTHIFHANDWVVGQITERENGGGYDVKVFDPEFFTINKK